MPKHISFSFPQTHRYFQQLLASMTAVTLYFPVPLLFTLLLLLASTQAINTRPKLDHIDSWYYSRALEMYGRAHTSSPLPALYYPEEDYHHFRDRLNNYRSSVRSDFGARLHSNARDGPGVMLIGSDQPRFGDRATYYASVITPENVLAGQMGLRTALPDAPDGRTTFVFWKYKKGHIRLLRIDTITNTGARYDLRKLHEIVPLDRLRKVR